MYQCKVQVRLGRLWGTFSINSYNQEKLLPVLHHTTASSPPAGHFARLVEIPIIWSQFLFGNRRPPGPNVDFQEIAALWRLFAMGTVPVPDDLLWIRVPVEALSHPAENRCLLVRVGGRFNCGLGVGSAGGNKTCLLIPVNDRFSDRVKFTQEKQTCSLKAPASEGNFWDRRSWRDYTYRQYSRNVMESRAVKRRLTQGAGLWGSMIGDSDTAETVLSGASVT